MPDKEWKVQRTPTPPSLLPAPAFHLCHSNWKELFCQSAVPEENLGSLETLLQGKEKRKKAKLEAESRGKQRPSFLVHPSRQGSEGPGRCACIPVCHPWLWEFARISAASPPVGDEQGELWVLIFRQLEGEGCGKRRVFLGPRPRLLVEMLFVCLYQIIRRWITFRTAKHADTDPTSPHCNNFG